MSRLDVARIREERASINAEQRSILEGAPDTGLTAEDTQNFDRLEARMTELDGDLRRLESVESFDAGETRSLTAETGTARVEDHDANYRSAFDGYLRTGLESGELRAAYAVGSNAAGGYTVPQNWETTLLGLVTQYNPIRDLATVKTTSHGQRINQPAWLTLPSAVIRDEGTSYTESEGTVRTVALDAYDVGYIAKVSKELVRDSAVDIDAEIQAQAGQVIGLQEDAYFLTGSGSSQPNGILTASSAAITAASATTVTADELIALYHQLTAPYRVNASWIISDAVALKLRTLKDSTNQYLWQPGLQAGTPDTFLGRPVYTDANMPALATGNKTVVFGDIRAGYVIRDVQGVSVTRLVERYADSGQIGYIVSHYTDGDVVDPNAIKVLKQA